MPNMNDIVERPNKINPYERGRATTDTQTCDKHTPYDGHNPCATGEMAMDMAPTHHGHSASTMDITHA